MAQKVDINQTQKTPPPEKLENIVKETEPPKNLEGIKPYIEPPEMVIKKAIRKSILIILLIAVITGGIIFYSWRQINSKAAALQSQQNLIYLANQQLKMSSDLERQWPEIAPNIAKINAMLPQATDLLGFMGALESIAQASGVQQTIKFQNQNASSVPVNIPGQIQPSTKGGSVDFSVELKGNLSQINTYLANVEQAPYFTKVIDVNITGGQGADNQDSATIGMKVYTYQ
jgi:hypothetical protein